MCAREKGSREEQRGFRASEPLVGRGRNPARTNGWGEAARGMNGRAGRVRARKRRCETDEIVCERKAPERRKGKGGQRRKRREVPRDRRPRRREVEQRKLCQEEKLGGRKNGENTSLHQGCMYEELSAITTNNPYYRSCTLHNWMPAQLLLECW